MIFIWILFLFLYISTRYRVPLQIEKAKKAKIQTRVCEVLELWQTIVKETNSTGLANFSQNPEDSMNDNTIPPTNANDKSQIAGENDKNSNNNNNRRLSWNNYLDEIEVIDKGNGVKVLNIDKLTKLGRESIAILSKEIR